MIVIVIFNVRIRARLKKPLEERRILSAKNVCLIYRNRILFIAKQQTTHLLDLYL